MCVLNYLFFIISLYTGIYIVIYFLQGRVQLFVRVWDVDTINNNDHVDDVYITIAISPNSQFTSLTNFYGIYGNSRLRLSFRVQCNSNYYGSDCATYCVPTDNVNGHYSCNAQGGKVCNTGWSGPDCNIGK